MHVSIFLRNRPFAIGAVALLTMATAYAAQDTASNEITRAVEDELRHDALVSLSDVRVATEHGVVTLTGSVATLLAKVRAAHITETLRGVSAVDNRLIVNPARPMDADDLESTILQALVADPATEAFNVTVEADPAGRVGLTGQVQSPAERQIAGRIAMSVAGVTRLDNKLSVNYEKVRTDSQIETEVESVIQWDAHIGDGLIEVNVRDGVVSLSGTVDSAAEKHRATQIAWTAGTQSVDASALKVAPGVRDGDQRSRSEANED